MEDTGKINRIKLENFNGETREYLIGIVICTYNRLYIKYTLEYFKKSNVITDNSILIIIDDDSIIKEVIDIIEEFTMYNLPIIKIFKSKNQGINHSLKIGWDLLAKLNVKYLTNIDSDVLVRRDWLDKILELHDNLYEKYQNNMIITGFKTTTHKAKIEHEKYNINEIIGGINMFFDTSLYLRFRDFAFYGRGWDWIVSYWMNNNDYPLIVLKPSVLQHIGFVGMFSNFETKTFDFAFDFKYDYDENFYLLPCFDSPGNDKCKIEGGIDEKLQKCLLDEDVVAVNHNGYMKYKVEMENEKTNIHQYSEFSGLYIKKDFYNKNFRK